MKLRGFIFYLFFSLISARADHPQDCPNQTLDSYNLNSPLSQTLLKDQKEAPICFAEVASDLAEYYLNFSNVSDKQESWKKLSEYQTLKFNESVKIHPLWLTYLAVRNKQVESLSEGGEVSNALLELKKHGYCESSYLDSVLKNSKTDIVSLIQSLDYLLEFKKNVLKQKKSSKTVNSCDRNIAATLDPLTKQLLDIPLNQLNLDRMMQNIFPLCFSGDGMRNLSKEKELPRPFTFYRVHKDFENSLKKMVQKSLDKLQLTSFIHCSSFYLSKSTQPPYFDESGNYLDHKSEGCDAHASLIIGQGYIENRCQYLVRQSWGNYELPERICLCWNKNKSLYSRCKDFGLKNKGEVMGCYLPQKELLQSTAYSTSLVNEVIKKELKLGLPASSISE